MLHLYFHRKNLWLLLVAVLSLLTRGVIASGSADELMAQGDQALAYGDFDASIQYYKAGLDALDGELILELSIYTNMATALSSSSRQKEAIEAYQKALLAYSNNIDEIVDQDMKTDAALITAQAAFFLGMEYQDMEHFQDAADAYAYANELDPLHWASVANLGALLQDHFKMYSRALEAYNKAYQILTDTTKEPTDPPEDATSILGQLQYRIGLCITYDTTQKCTLIDDPDTVVDCNEMARQAFSMAVRFEPTNELAKHMLATVTADATMSRASNEYVKSLFDDYAKNFEHSLVDELGYNGYERLRRGFDRAFNGNPPMFSKVIDAGCGTGLVGEQFKNISDFLIGIDLSQSIIDEAERMRPGLYDRTWAGDVLEAFVDFRPLSLIIAADSYIYFGDLVPLFEAMSKGLEDNGYAAFTLENVGEENERILSETNPDWRWQLTASGRFAHRKEYVAKVGEEQGLKVVHYEPLVNFRYEQGVGVRGHIFVMQKKTFGDDEL